jgi:hypothetical protein
MLGLAGLAGLVAPGAAEGSGVWCLELRRGESLAAAARRAGTSVDQLRRVNALRRGEPVRPRAILALPTLAALRRGQLALPAPSLRARPGHPVRENAVADAQRLTRLRSRRLLDRFRDAGLLVPVTPGGRGFDVVGVPAWRRVARPWTRSFVQHVGAAAHQLFGARLRVTDMTRTEAVQAALLTSNGNAGPASGPHRSSHLTGASVDLSKTQHSETEVQWLRAVLARLTARGAVLAIEEFAQPHFHVMVLRQYAGYAARLRSPALIGGC